MIRATLTARASIIMIAMVGASPPSPPSLPPASPPILCPCLTSYNAGIIHNADGTVPVAVSNTNHSYPGNYGLERCHTHDAGLAPLCDTTLSSGRFDPFNNPPWCSDSWCYVDPNNCNVATSLSQYLAYDTWYSYAACGASNAFNEYYMAIQPRPPPPPPCMESQEMNAVIDVVYRDFNRTHPDMYREVFDWHATTGLIESFLGPDRLPVCKSTTGNGTIEMLSNCSRLREWFTDVPGVNKRLNSTLTLDYNPDTQTSTYIDSFYFPLDGKAWNEVFQGSQFGGHNYLFTSE